MVFFIDYLHSHLFVKLPSPKKAFTGRTIIVTGSNTGMGLEAARHLVGLDAAKVILAVRNIQKGEAAKKSIEESEKRLGVVEVWELDLSKYDSVKAFAKRAESLERLDVVVENAGIYEFSFVMAEEDEQTITVNVVSTFLLALLLLPKLRETTVKFEKKAVLTFTGSFVHYLTSFEERKNPDIFESLKDEKTANVYDRYNVSKMIELLVTRELAAQLTASSKPGSNQIMTSIINPGFVATDIMRSAGTYYAMFVKVLKAMLARTAEEGGRTLVHAAEGGDETHGQYLDDCHPGKVSSFVSSPEGLATQKKLWAELMVKLDKIQPGLSQNI